MDAFAGYKEAVRRVVPHAREVLDPFHVVRLAGDRLTRCRQRLQQEATGRRGTKHDPLYKARRILLKTRATLTDRQRSTLGRLFGDERNKPLEVMWGAYQKIIACYAEPDRRKARGMMHELVDSINARPANAPGELMTLARTLKRACRTSWPTSTTSSPATGPPRPSTAGSNTCAASPSASPTSTTTSPEASCTPEDSDKPYRNKSHNHEPNTHENRKSR